MSIWANVSLLVLQLGIATILGTGAQAQTILGSPTIALKSKESSEFAKVYWVSHCRSLLRSTPEVEILDGPPGVSVTIKEGMVVPRYQQCAKPVPGGTLVISAQDIEDPSYTKLIVRVTFKTRDGVRQRSQVINLSLIP
jgi:hypothetical protein